MRIGSSRAIPIRYETVFSRAAYRNRRLLANCCAAGNRPGCKIPASLEVVLGRFWAASTVAASLFDSLSPDGILFCV